MRFVLVPGGMHGAWCFDRLVPELARLGHQSVAVDLPGHGVRRAEEATIDGYREAVVEVLQPGDVVVGHSMGCAAATMGVDSFPDIAHICYLGGALPFEGQPILTAMQTGMGSGGSRVPVVGGFGSYLEPHEDGRSLTMSKAGAAECFYHDCDTLTVEWAIARLTPQAVAVVAAEAVAVPDFWRLDPPRSYIRCLDDRAFLPEVSALQVARLGVEPLTIPGSHSPFLSRPALLADVLRTVVKTVAHGRLQPS